MAWLAWLALLTTHGLALLTTHGLACLTTHHMTQPLAVVTRHVARLLAHPLARRPLAEVLHQQVASTARRLLAVLPHAVQRLQLPLERLLRRVQLALRHRQQLFHARVVSPPVVQPAQRGLPVPSRLRLTAPRRAHAPRLLVIALHGFGETEFPPISGRRTNPLLSTLLLAPTRVLPRQHVHNPALTRVLVQKRHDFLHVTPPPVLRVLRILRIL